MDHTTANQNKAAGGVDDKDASGHYQQADSGFLSGDICDSSSALMVDDTEIGSSSKEISRNTIAKEESVTSSTSMHLLDSGIVDDGLGQSFSGLSLKDSATKLNDFNKPKIDVVEVCAAEETTKERPAWELYYQQDEEGNTQLHLAILTGLREACRSVICMAPHPCLLDIKNDRSQAALHLAVLTGQADLLRMLLVAGAEATIQDARGNSPLHLACRLGDMSSVRALTSPVQEREYEMHQQECQQTLDNQNKQTSTNHQQQQQQPQFRNTRPCQQLPPDLEQWNYDGEVCVHLAAREQHFDVLRHLVWYGADINAREGKSGCTVLHQAVKHNDRALVAFLLNECPRLAIETETYGGRTAYQLATDKEIMSMLESKGAVPLENSEDEYSDSDDTEMSSSSSSSTPRFYNFGQSATTNAINVA